MGARDLPERLNGGGSGRALGPARPVPLHWFGLNPHAPPPDIYRPDHSDWDRVRAVRKLALFLAGVAILASLPAWLHANVAAAPSWARLVWLVLVLQLAYIGWMAVTPDWSTVWVMMLVLSGTTAMYALGLAAAVLSQSNATVPLGMGAVRVLAGVWCGLMLPLHAWLVWRCGRMSVEWRRAIDLRTIAHVQH